MHNWGEELKLLRKIVLACGLLEEFKWSQPCYTFENGNVLLVTAFNAYAAIAFFKGTLLKDPQQLLIAPGNNSQAVRQLRFTSVQDIIGMEPLLKAFIFEAIENEKAGLTVTFKQEPEPMLPELLVKLNENPELKTAFESLTPGRQRGYLLHFSQPKQSKTRASRIERCIEKILQGKGFNER